MCDALGSRSLGRPRPRWNQLYGFVSLAVVSMAAVDFVVPRGTVRTLAEGALALGVCLAAMMWVRANRVALDLLEWCDCASTTVRPIVPLAAESPLLDALADTPVPLEITTREEVEAEVEALAGPRVP